MVGKGKGMRFVWIGGALALNKSNGHAYYPLLITLLYNPQGYKDKQGNTCSDDAYNESSDNLNVLKA